jgi:hypothetical protein
MHSRSCQIAAGLSTFFALDANHCGPNGNPPDGVNFHDRRSN